MRPLAFLLLLLLLLLILLVCNAIANDNEEEEEGEEDGRGGNVAAHRNNVNHNDRNDNDGNIRYARLHEVREKRKGHHSNTDETLFSKFINSKKEDKEAEKAQREEEDRHILARSLVDIAQCQSDTTNISPIIFLSQMRVGSTWITCQLASHLCIYSINEHWVYKFSKKPTIIKGKKKGQADKYIFGDEDTYVTTLNNESHVKKTFEDITTCPSLALRNSTESFHCRMFDFTPNFSLNVSFGDNQFCRKHVAISVKMHVGRDFDVSKMKEIEEIEHSRDKYFNSAFFFALNQNQIPVVFIYRRNWLDIFVSIAHSRRSVMHCVVERFDRDCSGESVRFRSRVAVNYRRFAEFVNQIKEEQRLVLEVMKEIAMRKITRTRILEYELIVWNEKAEKETFTNLLGLVGFESSQTSLLKTRILKRHEETFDLNGLIHDLKSVKRMLDQLGIGWMAFSHQDQVQYILNNVNRSDIIAINK